MTQLNGGFTSNSINHCFDMCSNIICTWHYNARRNTMMHPIHRWRYQLKRVSEFIILSTSPDFANPSCTVGSDRTQSRHALAHRRIVCGGQSTHPKQSTISAELSPYLHPHTRIKPPPHDDRALHDLVISIRCHHSKNGIHPFIKRGRCRICMTWQ